MKLSDVRTNPGLMREHGLIRGWAYPRDSMASMDVHTVVSLSEFVHTSSSHNHISSPTLRHYANILIHLPMMSIFLP